MISQEVVTFEQDSEMRSYSCEEGGGWRGGVAEGRVPAEAQRCQYVACRPV